MDPKKGTAIRGYRALEETVRAAEKEYLGDAFGKSSFSGNEKNRFFLNLGGKQFADLTGLSGAGHEGDGRAFGLLDYDRDGWLDIAAVNTNAPALTLYHNEIGELRKKDGHFVALRLVGGNHAGTPSTEWSNRDGIGAIVTLRVGGRELRRHLAAGEGFATQNSATMLVGIGAAGAIEGGEVRWPSGKTTTLPALDAGEIVRCFENPEEAADRTIGVDRGQYRDR